MDNKEFIKLFFSVYDSLPKEKQMTLLIILDYLKDKNYVDELFTFIIDKN